jgi:hypothetical protein
MQRFGVNVSANPMHSESVHCLQVRSSYTTSCILLLSYVPLRSKLGAAKFW